jgi:DNA repair protein RecN (Recombination protein N)
MIETLRIEGLAVVESAQIEFGPGLNVLTGETGAGKSIVLGALGLLAGARASQDAIRVGADEAAVEAVFRTDRLPDLVTGLERHGIAPDAGELVVRRSLTRSGRSRARVGGQLVPVSTLAELFAGRLEISSQHESQQLLHPGAHGLLLDATGDLLAQREKVARGFEALRSLDRERMQLRAEAEERARREDFLAFQVREIDEAKLVPGEDEALRTEHVRLANAERLCGEAQVGAQLLAGEANPSEGPAALDRVAEAARRLESLADLDPSLRELGERMRSLQAELDDVARELSRYGASIEGDPARLGEVEDRIQQLDRLRRKYGSDAESILCFRDQAAQELAALGGAEERLGGLEAQRAALWKRLEGDAARLSAGRAEAARRLASDVEGRLHQLSMPAARFEVVLEPIPPSDEAPCGPSGAERPEFRFSANPGELPRALRRVASGGELSRVFLAAKSAMRRAAGGMVLVFDEVDAGIGGRVADRVGRVLAELSREHQVLCITHLPQIAACADLHLRVTKRVQGGRTLAAVTPLTGEARVEEIARMAAGERVGEATRRHARSLLRSRPRP